MQKDYTLRGTWMRTLLIVVCAWLLPQAVHAQFFQLYGLDVSKFPQMSAHFVAQDAAGNDYPSVSNSDFNIVESGVPLDAVTTYECRDTAVPPAANVVLILDRSGSMSTIVDTATKASRMDWVIAGATSFLNTFKFVPPSEVAVISFGTIPTFESSFRNTAAPLINVISKLKPQGGTEYNPPMLDTAFGAIKLLSGEPPTVRRIIIFLTDGQPDHTPARDSMIHLCNLNAIQFYAITVGTNMNADLKAIADATGGKSFVALTEADLVQIYKLIALQTEIKKLCTVTWTAPYACNQSQRDRDVKITFKRPNTPITSELTYIAPANAVASVGLSANTLYFGDPNPNASTTQTITFKPVNAPLIITSLTPSPSQYFTVADVGGGKSLPITVQPGDSIVITIKFTQGNTKGYRQASLVVGGSPCPPLVSMFGGLSSVQVLSPSGDIKTTCDSITVKWGGVDINQLVDIYYRDEDDPNPTWKVIATSVKGLSYTFKPTFSGKHLRIRITSTPPKAYLWTRDMGGPLLDSTRSIALDNREFYAYVGGVFSDTMRVTNSSKTVASAGGKDAFVGRYDSDGYLTWLESIGGTGDEGIAAVATDQGTSAYVCGYFTSKYLQVGQTLKNLGPQDAVNMFVACYDSSGNVTWAQTAGGTALGTGYCYADSISVVRDSVFVFGHYKTKIHIGNYPTGSPYELTTTSTSLRTFTAVFNRNDGSFISLVPGSYGRSPVKYSTQTVTDANGNIYDCGFFKGTQNNGSTALNLTSRGDYDCYVRKFGGQPGSSDSADNTFSIQSPILSVKSPQLTCPTISVGLASDTVFKIQLCNSGDIPLLIAQNAVSLSGANPGDFKITSNYDGQVMFPGSCYDIEVHFQPTAEGLRSATLVVNSVCGSPASVELQGNALPPCKFESSTPYIGTSGVNVPIATKSAPCIIRNNSASMYSGTIELIGVNSAEFTVNFPNMTPPASLHAGDAPLPFSLQANKDCLAATIDFTPAGVGARTATLKFNIPVQCGLEADVPLIGYGLAANIRVDSVPFGFQRVLTSKTLPVKISNNDTLDALLSGIAMSSGTSPFKIDPTSLPSFPYNLKKGTNITVQVIFTPTAEGPFSDYVTASVSGSSTTYQGLATGEGFIPQISAADLTFPAVPVGQTSGPLQLVIKNTHHRVPLYIKSIGAPSNNRFTFVGTPLSNFSIQPDSSYSIPVNLSPIAGTNTATVDIHSDAKEGPMDLPDVDTLSVVHLTGEGLQISLDPEVAPFGDVLSCDSTQTRTMTLKNDGSSQMIVDVTATGRTDAFDIQPAVGTDTLQSGQSVTYTIRYRGTPGNGITMTMSFTLPSGTQTRTFTANGVTASMDINANNMAFNAGERKQWVETFSIPTLKNVTVYKLALEVRFDSTLVSFDTQQFRTTNAGWTWAYTPNAASSGTWVVTGTSVTGVTGGSVTCNVPLRLLNPTVTEVPISATWYNSTDYPCIVPSVTNAIIQVNQGCYSKGSQIVPIGTPLALRVSPNPVTGSTIDCDFGVPAEGNYTLEIVNTIGERVALVADGTNAGDYHSITDVSALSSGVYFVRLVTPYGISTQILSIGR